MPRPRSGRRPATTALVLLALGTTACSTPPPPVGHVHRHSATVIVTEAELLPSPAITIPAFATVVWRNRSAQPMTVEVAAAACPECDTVLAFTAGERGARSTRIAPGAVATLCFHEPGMFAFTAQLGDVTHRGTVEVGPAR